MTAEFGTCPRCREVIHDSDCTLVGDGRPAEDGPRAWAGACVHCRRAIQSDDPAGPWVDAFGRSECLATTDRHQPEVPVAYSSVTADDWVSTE